MNEVERAERGGQNSTAHVITHFLPPFPSHKVPPRQHNESHALDDSNNIVHKCFIIQNVLAVQKQVGLNQTNSRRPTEVDNNDTDEGFVLEDNLQSFAATDALVVFQFRVELLLDIPERKPTRKADPNPEKSPGRTIAILKAALLQKCSYYTAVNQDSYESDDIPDAEAIGRKSGSFVIVKGELWNKGPDLDLDAGDAYANSHVHGQVVNEARLVASRNGFVIAREDVPDTKVEKTEWQTGEKEPGPSAPPTCSCAIAETADDRVIERVKCSCNHLYHSNVARRQASNLKQVSIEKKPANNSVASLNTLPDTHSKFNPVRKRFVKTCCIIF